MPSQLFDFVSTSGVNYTSGDKYNRQTLQTPAFPKVTMTVSEVTHSLTNPYFTI